jgi:hypothetical protein
VGGGGDASNAWVNANDYNTYTTLVGFINTVQDNVAAGGGGDLISDQFTVSSSNIFTLSQSATSANNILVSLNGIVQRPTDDYIVAGTTLTLANIEPLASGIAVEVRHLSAGSSGGTGDESNLYNTYTTLTANDYNSYTTLTANIYNTFAYLNANVGGGGGGNTAVNIISDQYTISTTNTFTLTKTVSDANNIIVSLDGIVQNPNDDYIVSGTTLTFNNTAPLPAGREVEVRHIVGGGDAANTWLNANDYVTYDTLTANIYNTFAYLNANVGGGGGGGITTGKAIAMAMIFGG